MRKYIRTFQKKGLVHRRGVVLMAQVVDPVEPSCHVRFLIQYKWYSFRNVQLTEPRIVRRGKKPTLLLSKAQILKIRHLHKWCSS